MTGAVDQPNLSDRHPHAFSTCRASVAGPVGATTMLDDAIGCRVPQPGARRLRHSADGQSHPSCREDNGRYSALAAETPRDPLRIAANADGMSEAAPQAKSECTPTPRRPKTKAPAEVLVAARRRSTGTLSAERRAASAKPEAGAVAAVTGASPQGDRDNRTQKTHRRARTLKEG